MDWLPEAVDLRARLREAAAQPPAERLDALARLARTRLGFLEEMQLDHALRGLPEQTPGMPLVRLALLGSSTVDQLLPSLRVAGLRHGLRLSVQTGRYGQYRQALLDPASALRGSGFDFIALSLAAHELVGHVPLQASAAQVDEALDAAVDGLRTLWHAAQQGWGATVIQQSVIDTSEPLFGSLDQALPSAPASLAAALNARAALAARQSGVLWLDLLRALRRDGLDRWFDIGRWLQAKMEIAPGAAPAYAELLLRLIAAQRGRSRKCLVLDLDNTLWGGVLGDDGIEGIVLGQGSARGEAHLALQRHALLLKQRGIVLAVCSKNDPALAERAFREHPEMLLKREDISVFVANWDDKAANVQRIAAQLNLGLDSLVFVDDNPAERGRIRQALPMVAVPELPADPALYVRVLAEAGYFEAVSFTREDSERAGQYAANAQRDELRAAAGSVDEFLRSLRMSLSFGPVQAADSARAEQLVNKTNQFNTTTRRLAAGELQRYLDDASCAALQFRLRDCFGDNGLVSVMLFSPARESSVLELDNWVMSCRVFGRQLEDEALNIAVEFARARGFTALSAQFVPTPKNAVIADLFARLGFQPIGESGWRLPLDDYRPRPTHIDRSPP